MVLTAERVYHALMERPFQSAGSVSFRQEFHVDDHDLWEQERDPSAAKEPVRISGMITESGCRPRWRPWDQKKSQKNQQSLLDSIQVEMKKRYDYRQF